MQIEINNHFTPDGKEFYYWTLYDGPDGIDEVKGFATDLIEVFSKIMEWRERIGADYAKELPEEMEAAAKFTKTGNETEF
jgi:hypothetical protein